MLSIPDTLTCAANITERNDSMSDVCSYRAEKTKDKSLVANLQQLQCSYGEEESDLLSFP